MKPEQGGPEAGLDRGKGYLGHRALNIPEGSRSWGESMQGAKSMGRDENRKNGVGLGGTRGPGSPGSPRGPKPSISLHQGKTRPPGAEIRNKQPQQHPATWAETRPTGD